MKLPWLGVSQAVASDERGFDVQVGESGKTLMGFIGRNELRPTLIFDEICNDRNFCVMSLVRVVSWPQRDEPQKRCAKRAESQGNRADNNDQHPQRHVENQGLDRVEFYKGPVFLIFHQQNDYRDDRDWVAKRRPELIIAGNIGRTKLVRHCVLPPRR
jgi:hypothetical protein